MSIFNSFFSSFNYLLFVIFTFSWIKLVVFKPEKIVLSCVKYGDWCSGALVLWWVCSDHHHTAVIPTPWLLQHLKTPPHLCTTPWYNDLIQHLGCHISYTKESKTTYLNTTHSLQHQTTLKKVLPKLLSTRVVNSSNQHLQALLHLPSLEDPRPEDDDAKDDAAGEPVENIATPPHDERVG